MKKNLLYLFIAIFILGYFSLPAYSDYSWDKIYLQEKSQDWLLFLRQANVVDLTRIYSLFKPPTVRLGLIEKSSIREVSDKVYFVKAIWVNRDIGGGPIKEETFQYLLDCNNYRTGWGSGGKNLDQEDTSLETVEWGKTPTDEEALKTYQEECRVVEEFVEKSSRLRKG